MWHVNAPVQPGGLYDANPRTQMYAPTSIPRITMRVYNQLFSITSLVASFTSAQYVQSIDGLGLIGSHFGIPFFNATFDYVVVGGGTAGLTIATRLAQNSAFSVAVIEAGGFAAFNNGNLSSIPAFNAYWVGKSPGEKNPLIDWGMETEPMSGFGDTKMLYSSGKTLGGSSSRNSMTYQRPTKGALDRWADTVGEEDWNWENMLPFFEKSVLFNPPKNDLRPVNATPKYDIAAYQPGGGPLQVSFPNHANAFSSWGTKALEELGLNETNGNAGGELLGYSYITYSVEGTQQCRSSSETSFLSEALKTTTNLNVYTQTLAKQILFSNDKKATAVVVDTAGLKYTISAAKEVIVSAGAMRSPQLLMASGVGPQDTLSSLGIPVVAARAGVGQNMQDHVMWAASYEVDVATHSRMGDAQFAAAQINAYITNRTGVLTNTATDPIGWEKLPATYRANLSNDTLEGLAAVPADWPDFELIFADAYGGNFKDFVADAPLNSKNYASIGMALQVPFSRGNVTLASADTAINPIINPNLFGNENDLDLAVQSFKRIREIAASGAMKSIIIGAEAFPGTNISSDADIRALLRGASDTVYHASCTCAMGKSENAMTVVDSEAKVVGVSGLRVVDASVFPFLTPGHPQSVVCELNKTKPKNTLDTNTSKMQLRKRLRILS